MIPERAAFDLPAPMVRQIEFTGLEIPLLAFPDRPDVVVLGGRRARALVDMPHYDAVPLFVARNPADLDLWCTADHDLQAWAVVEGARPWTWRERSAVLDAALKVFEHRPGASRSAARGSAIGVLAHYFGVREVQLRNAMYLWRFELAGGEVGGRATRWLEVIERGDIKPQSAYRKLRAADPLPGEPVDPRSRISVGDQSKGLRNAAGVLSGLVMGLAQLGDISPDLPDEVRREVLAPIEDARRLLTRLARQLQVGEPAKSNTDKGDEA